MTPLSRSVVTRAAEIATRMISSHARHGGLVADAALLSKGRAVGPEGHWRERRQRKPLLRLGQRFAQLGQIAPRHGHLAPPRSVAKRHPPGLVAQLKGHV